MDSIDRIIAYEQGELEEDEVVALFQELVDSGLAWSLQGHYGRTASNLIRAGLVTPVLPAIDTHAEIAKASDAGLDIYEVFN